MVIAIVLLSLIICVMAYVIYVQIVKYNRLLAYTEMYVQFIGAIAIRTQMAYDEMKEIDRLGAFQADDEVGVVFQEINNNIKDLNEFIAKYVNASTEETSTQS